MSKPAEPAVTIYVRDAVTSKVLATLQREIAERLKVPLEQVKVMVTAVKAREN